MKEVLPAIIAAIASISVALIAQLLGFGTSRKMERLKADLQEQLEGTRSELAEQKSAKDARRDYEYDARKRLYEKIEPLMFQLYEASEQAYYRVKSLAMAQREGFLGSKGSWLGNEGSYLYSTAYYLLLPIGVYRSIQKNITFVDINLDRSIAVKYYLAKIYYWILTDDYIVADREPKLFYPHRDQEDERSKALPSVNLIRQGIGVSQLETIADAMLDVQPNQVKVISLRQFIAAAKKGETPSGDFRPIIYLLMKFNFERFEITSRLLLCMATLCHVIWESYEVDPDLNEIIHILDKFLASDDFEKALSWASPIPASERALIREYLVERLEWIPKKVFE